MKTTQLNQIIENAEAILLKQKAAKGDMNLAIAEVNQMFIENGVNMDLAQTEKFANEYFAKRLSGEK